MDGPIHMLWSGEEEKAAGTFSRKKTAVPALAVTLFGWKTGSPWSGSITVMTTAIAPFGAVVAILDVDARVGTGVGAGGADVATEGLGETALGDGRADGSVVVSAVVGELVGVGVATAPQPSTANASATTRRARLGSGRVVTVGQW